MSKEITIKKYGKKFIIRCLTIIVIIIVLIHIVSTLNIKSSLKEFKISNANVSGYTNRENELVSNRQDARLYFKNQKTLISSFQLFFDKPLKQDSSIVVYFNIGKKNSEKEKLEFILKKGETQTEKIILNMVARDIRVDLGFKKGQVFSFDKMIINDNENNGALRDRFLLNSFVMMGIFLIFICLILGIIYLFYICFYKKKLKIEKFGAIVVMLFGVIYLLIITPLAPPDESYHYGSAYKLSNVIMLKFDHINEGSAAHFDNTDFVGHDNAVTAYKRVARDLFKKPQEGKIIKISDHTDSLSFPVFYIPQSIGITIGRLLNLNFIWIFYLGRFFNLLSFSIMIYFALKLVPRYKATILMIALLPMNLQQISSYSSDAFINGISLVLVASILGSSIRTDQMSRKEFLRILILGILLAPAKVVYSALLLLVFLIPKERYRNNKAYIISNFIIFISAFIAIMITKMPQILNLAVEHRTAMNWEGCNTFSLSYIVHHPISTLRIFINTFETKTSFYITTCLGAALCGYSISISMVIINSFAILLLLSALKTKDDHIELGKKNKFLIIVSSFGIVCMVILSMMLGWTSDFHEFIEGVQGRYYLPIVFPILLLLSNKVIVIKRNIDQILIGTFMAFQFFVIYEILCFTLQKLKSNIFTMYWVL